jgi:hypothetical protein
MVVHDGQVAVEMCHGKAVDHGERHPSRMSLDVACLDRIYLNGYLPTVQVPGQVVQFLQHRGFPIPSPAVVEKTGTGFRDAVKTRVLITTLPEIAWQVVRRLAAPRCPAAPSSLTARATRVVRRAPPG